jgi:hypothetical protein
MTWKREGRVESRKSFLTRHRRGRDRVERGDEIEDAPRHGPHAVADRERRREKQERAVADQRVEVALVAARHERRERRAAERDAPERLVLLRVGEQREPPGNADTPGERDPRRHES